MEATKIKILTKANGKRAAYYRGPESTSWFSMKVPEAIKALREGKAHIGIDKDIPVVAA